MIKDVRGNSVTFKMNVAQEYLYNNMHYYNVILKARQLGFSTFIMIYMLDCCLFNSNQACGIIAHTKQDAEDIFKNKIRFAYDKLPSWLRSMFPAKSETARNLEFDNGSSIVVGTSLRGGTLQKLHVSEYGKIAARYPEKAKEIKSGALNTVHNGQQIFIESTAEGQSGEFFEVCEVARKLKELDRPLTPLDPKFHFFPWYENPEYLMDDFAVDNTSISQEQSEYFAKLPVELTPHQKAWYVKKEAQQGELMKREYPSTPKEAFEQSMEGAYYTKEMTILRRNKQIRNIPHEPRKPVYTFWDLNRGGMDYMTCLFFQDINNEYRFIDYEEAYSEGWDYWVNLLSSKGYAYKQHYFPHDGAHSNMLEKGVKTTKQIAQEMGIRPVKIVERSSNVHQTIRDVCRPALRRSAFDEHKCSKLLAHLDGYRKEWDDKLGQWKDKPRHDDASHGADGFRTFASGWEGRIEELNEFNGIEHMQPQMMVADSNYNILEY